MKRSFVPDSTLMSFFEDFTKATIESARVRLGERVSMDVPANTSGITLIRPGGRNCYPAVWTQDFAITLGTGFVTPEEMADHLAFIARCQNGPRGRRLKSGAIIPPFAIPDHVLFNGKPVFYPGTYSSGSDQGGEPWGIVPPSNNHFDLILIAHHLWKATGDPSFLRRRLDGISMIERLRRAFLVPRADAETGLIFTDSSRRAVGFIFCDSIYMTGHLLFASLLRWRAARQLADLERALKNGKKAETWLESTKLIPGAVAATFSEPARIGGWLMAATQVGRQPDVWGTIYALYLGILSKKAARSALAEIVKALEEGTILYLGAVRHVPTNHDYSTATAWEKSPTEHNTYQNGAYWHTPAGWLISVLATDHPDWARRIFYDMMTHFREEDFRKGPEFNAPWECFGLNGRVQRNPLFLGSVVVPYGALRGMK